MSQYVHLQNKYKISSGKIYNKLVVILGLQKRNGEAGE